MVRYASSRNKSTFPYMTILVKLSVKLGNQSINMFIIILSERLNLQRRCCMQMLQVRQKQGMKLQAAICFNNFFHFCQSKFEIHD